MSAEQVTYRIAAGDILEGRVRRADGTYERVKVLGMEKGCAEVEVLNPRNARTPGRRKLYYLAAWAREAGASPATSWSSAPTGRWSSTRATGGCRRGPRDLGGRARRRTVAAP